MREIIIDKNGTEILDNNGDGTSPSLNRMREELKQINQQIQQLPPSIPLFGNGQNQAFANAMNLYNRQTVIIETLRREGCLETIEALKAF
jgi:hypothetical protein